MKNYMALKIMIVDDKPENVVSLSKFLSKFDFNVEVVTSGKRALERLEKEEFGLLVINVHMPDMNGFELTGIIKSKETTKDLPIILTTSSVEEKDFEIACLQCGAVDFARKPFDIIVLMLKIRNYLEFSYAMKMVVETNAELKKVNLLLEENIKYSNGINLLLAQEKMRSDDLLLNILPWEVAEELKNKGRAEARHYNNVTVLFTDFVGFTKAGERFKPQELVNELDFCFREFDLIIQKYNIEKIKTIGDAYMAVSGLPTDNPNHAKNVIYAAIEINEFMERRRTELGDKTFEIRIGIHSGDVIAGIVGLKKFAYDIWGDTVNTASRIEHSSEPNKINISHSTFELVKEDFKFEYRGEINVKGKGDLSMYFLER